MTYNNHYDDIQRERLLVNSTSKNMTTTDVALLLSQDIICKLRLFIPIKYGLLFLLNIV
jgi:hypothetical protein